MDIILMDVDHDIEHNNEFLNVLLFELYINLQMDNLHIPNYTPNMLHCHTIEFYNVDKIIQILTLFYVNDQNIVF